MQSTKDFPPLQPVKQRIVQDQGSKKQHGKSIELLTEFLQGQLLHATDVLSRDHTPPGSASLFGQAPCRQKHNTPVQGSLEKLIPQLRFCGTSAGELPPTWCLCHLVYFLLGFIWAGGCRG